MIKLKDLIFDGVKIRKDLFKTYDPPENSDFSEPFNPKKKIKTNSSL